MLPPLLDQIIQALAGIASPILKDKIQRNETVIRLLQQFNLDPEHPPSDFSGVYAYALVEYGVGRPRQLLEIFRHEEVKQAFRKAFDHNNPSILLSEVDTFLDSYTLGSEVRSLGLDVRRETAQFATVFIEVAKRSRTPSDVLMSHQLGSLHKHIAAITEQLNRLPNLEGIRTEIARLAAENYPALPGASAATENNCKAIAIAQQMRGWFETLGYRFEKYELWSDSYFEWIINIPVRRNRYDRILVRGIAGEMGLGDVMALRQSVETQCTDEGWLITSRRVSRAARDEVEKEENRDLGCYTFDELLAADADFSGYLDWLEAEVKRREIDTKYVPLACNKEEIDPFSKRSIAVSRYSEQDGWIDGYIDRWLDDPAKEHISILGEFGTGKTWFALHYAWVTLQRYRDAQKRGTELPRLPLVIPLRDYAKAVSVESLFSEFFFRQYKIPLPHYDAFVQLNRMGKLLLIFDGFDEMAAKVDKQEMINNFWELAKVVVPGAKVILTCRTEHFPEAQEGRALLNAELQASTKNLTGEKPQFEVLELEKFNDEQIRSCLSFQAAPATVEIIMGNPQLLDLARRPVMTELILEALPDIEAGKPVDMARVYFYAVRRKMQRDIKAERTFTSLADKLYFLCELSWEMLSTDQMNLNYRLFPDRIRRLFGTFVREKKDLDHWHYDMMSQTMLIRNAHGDYTPAHRSLLEFFVAYKFAAELGVLADDFTSLAQGQSNLDESATPQDYTWSSYFYRQVDEAGEILPIATLKDFTSESLEELRKRFGKAPLSKAVMDLMVKMVGNCQFFMDVIETTRGKSENEVGYVAGNTMTLAVQLNQMVLEGRDFSSVVIKGADFSGASLWNVNFARSNLIDSVFTQVLSGIWSVAFSPDGKLFATGDINGAISLWNTSTRREILTCKGHTDRVYSITFSPDGQTLASGSIDQTIRLWNIHTGQCFHTLQGHTYWVYSITFSPDGQILASGSGDQTIRLWDISSGECLYILQGHTNQVYSVVFSPDGQTLASGSADETIRLWNAHNGQCLYILKGHTYWVCSIAFSPDGQTIVSGSADQTIRLWNAYNGQGFHTLQGYINVVYSVTFSPDGQVIASGGADQTIRLWNFLSGECFHTLQGHTNRIRSIAFSPDGQTLASGSADQTVRLWDTNTGQCLNTLQGHTSWIFSVAFSPDGATLASGSGDRTVRFWDTNTGQCLNILQGHNNMVNSVAFSPDGATLASGSDDRTVRLWDINTGQCLNILQEHINSINSVAFSPDSAMLVTGSDDQTIRLWDINTGQCLNTLHHASWVDSVIFSPNATIVACGSGDQTVRLWDINTGQCLNTLQGHTSWVFSVSFSPDGQTLSSGSWDGTIKLWDIKTGKCLKTLISKKPYEGMNITSLVGLTKAEIATLKALGAVENREPIH